MRPLMPESPRMGATARLIRASVFADLAPHIEAHAKRGGRLIALHIGDTCLPPPGGARFAEVAEDASLYRYGGIHGTERLRDACAAWLRARGKSLPGVEGRRHVLVGCGATHALFCAARAAFDPGDEVLVGSPYWPLSVGVLRSAGAIPVEVPLTSRLYREKGLDAGALFEAAITPRTRGLYVISPNNPDGKVLSREDLMSIARVARERNLWVVSDEVYADYAYEVPHVSMAGLEGMADRTLTAYSFSKSHALAGARVGIVVAPERVIDVARRVSTHTIFNVPVLSQEVCARALAAGEAWVDGARKEYLRARDAAVSALSGSPARFSIAEGGSYLFLDFEELLAGRPLVTLLERAIHHGVLLAPGDAFGAGFERCARLCFTSVPEAEMLRGIEALRAAMDELR